MTNNSELNEKPCLVQTQQGFSVLYKQRYLYSKYSPNASILKIITNLTILPNTLILCYAPVLGYGLHELLEKMPSGCHILTVDFDEALHTFFKENCVSKTTDKVSSVLMHDPAEIVNILNEGKLVPPPGSFKRALIIKMSGGTVFNEEAYSATTEYADSFIQNFWKNQITLTRMGRMYALDILRNLKAIGTSCCETVRPLNKGSVSKPILVIGAGTSIDKLLPKLTAYKQNFFILCVDAALPALLKNGIFPDAVVAVECQVAIEKAYIGAADSGIHVIADLTSRPRVTRLCAGEVSFFLSEYCKMPFMAEIKTTACSLGIPVFPPLGSVGLYAVEIALYMRKTGTPVFVCGLDFSFVPGQTHCKGAPAHISSALTANRLKPVGFPGAAYNYSARTIVGKSGRTEYTDAALSGYGALYVDRYKNADNLFDCAETGMKSSLPLISMDTMFDVANAAPSLEKNSAHLKPYAVNDKSIGYIENQKKKLLRIKSILTGTEKPHSDTELEELIVECGYLYAHFPDSAAGFRMTQDFLNRIRAEVDLFLKALGN